jgi:predicted dehydrogenase
MQQRRYVQVGLGGRHEMFRNAVIRDFKDTCTLVALCDSNPGRLALSVAQARELGADLKAYDAGQFDQMIREMRPDAVIVTSQDSTHDDYICRAMELGCDVVTEKPMTTDDQKCRRILETQARTGREIRVTFNYRYAPPRSQIKEMLMDGLIGNILSVDFHWMLDVYHGADYFRRWHREKKNSGGLMVHKATHHFDLMNWWLSTVPETVYASGQRKFYTPQTAGRFGLADRAERCRDCPCGARCPFHMDMAGNANIKKLYLDCEKHDGYHRDRCVFSANMDIEDTMNVLVDYRNGVKMSYSLNAFMPWEGYTIAFNGTRGRLEHKCEETVYINADGSIPGALKAEGTWTKVFPHYSPAYSVEVWKGSGGHGGADPIMLRDIFAPGTQEKDKFLRAADQRSGAWSILTGIAANRSMREKRPVRIDELVPGLSMPDYPPMPTDAEPLSGPQPKKIEGANESA